MKNVQIVSGKVSSSYVEKFLKDNKDTLLKEGKNVLVLSLNHKLWKIRAEKLELFGLKYTSDLDAELVGSCNTLLLDDIDLLRHEKVYNSNAEIVVFLQQSLL